MRRRLSSAIFPNIEKASGPPHEILMKPNFEHKIKTRASLEEAIGRRPRGKSVIMCHGVFDIVHPGHLRHLLYAKEKADLLVASLTADLYITKGNTRPYVPQDLRAANLAAFEMVDFVFIDENPTPIENILRLQPDFFAKGFEYNSEGVPAKTQEEIDAVESYGGEMVFTPGDIVYSSSALLEQHLPDLSTEKLLVLMEAENTGFDDLRRVFRESAGIKVHVVGDTIVDGYTHTSLLGPAQKTPNLSVRHEFTHHYAGGAAVVARNLRSIGAEVSFSTVVGDDALHEFVSAEMESMGITFLPIVDKTRPTPYKERFICQDYKLLQVNRVDNRAISDRILGALCESIRDSDAGLVIFSDYRHGIFNQETIARLKASIPAGVFKAADSQVSNRWGNILDFTGFDLITPNEREARFALGDQDSIVRPMASKLFARAGCKALILKLGARGLIACRSPDPDPGAFFSLDSFVEHLVDPMGAGDGLLAAASLAIASSGDMVAGVLLGAVAAAVTCETEGNIPLTAEKVLEKIAALEKRACYG